MKNLKNWSIVALLAMIFLAYSCSDDEDYALKNVKVTLAYPKGITVKEGVSVKANSSSGANFELKTDATGSVVFQIPVGTYEFSAAEVRTNNGKLTAYNGVVNKLIGEEWKDTDVLSLNMLGSTKSQLILKEVYCGGCPNDENPKRIYQFDSYIILYNNSPEPVDLQNLCFGSVQSNSFAMVHDIEDGDIQPRWFKEDWTPASVGYFYFPNKTILEPYKEITIVVNGAIDHTQVHSQSVDLSSAKNYIMYDIEKFNNKYRYPAPSVNIPVSNYLKASKFAGVPNNAWGIPVKCPNIFIFYPQGQTPIEYGNDVTNLDFWRKSENFPRKKVSADWIVDAIDAFASGYDGENVKRINPKSDAGHIMFVSGKGYTLYRNVDKDLTESIDGNKEKLVYNYSMGTETVEAKYGSTDPSGIDAESSIANGAIIIYKDTNNSGSDFHMRKKSALRK